MASRLRLTLLGVGAMASPRFAPAGLPLVYGRHRVVFDGGPGAEPPPGRLEAWRVTDGRAELRSALRRLAAERGLVRRTADADFGELPIRVLPIAHTSHPTCGYRIEEGPVTAVWAPEFWTFLVWAANADQMFADAGGDRPIRFRGGVGGYAPVREVGREAARHGIGRPACAHIGRPCLRAMDAGLRPEYGEWCARDTHAFLHRPAKGSAAPPKGTPGPMTSGVRLNGEHVADTERPASLLGRSGRHEDRRHEEAVVTEPLHDAATEERTVRELMSAAPYSISEDESLLMAWEVLERSRQRHLPVVRKDGCCTGVLGRAELAVACAVPGTALSRRRLRDLVRGRRRTAAVHAEDSMRRAASVMTEADTDALPVIDSHGCLVGLLTAKDYVAAVAALPHRTESPTPKSPFAILPGLPPLPWERERGISIP